MRLLATTLLFLLLGVTTAEARDAAFVEPGAAIKGSSNEALVADPKETDTGESVVGVARRVTLFFSNQSSNPVTIGDLTVNGDGNVTSEIVSDDCKKIGKIPAFTRCSVVLSIVPSSPGPWTVEILATHDGLGRIARAQINGTTLGERKESSEKTMGLALSTQKIDPVDFGDVEVGVGEPVRSALVFNDSNEDITILSIELIAAANGLARLQQGCEVDMMLRPGESCPITLQWMPNSRGIISTDLIVRHSGRVGFMVVQVRGKTTGGEGTPFASSSSSDGKTSSSSNNSASASETPAPPPSALDLDKLAASLPRLSSSALKDAAKQNAVNEDIGADFFLVGTVGNRAILQRGTSASKVVAEGASADVGGVTIKLVSVAPRTAKIELNGETRELKLGGAPVRPSRASNNDGKPAAPTAPSASMSTKAGAL
jgi:hypothetical protein